MYFVLGHDVLAFVFFCTVSRFNKTVRGVFCLFVLLTFLLLCYLNNEMLKIAKSKRISSTKAFSTCFWTVLLFFVSSALKISLVAYRTLSNTPLFKDTLSIILGLWSMSFVCFGSTFSCIVLFWMNSNLRREGTKIIKSLRNGIRRKVMRSASSFSVVSRLQ